MRPTWEEYALMLAQTASVRSQDPFIKVGACALRWDNTVASLGYNGPPPKIDIDWSDRDERRKRVCHAEVNVLKYIKPGECRLIASTLLPCNSCLLNIAAYQIPEIIYVDVYKNDTSSLDLAKELNIRLIKYEKWNLTDSYQYTPSTITLFCRVKQRLSRLKKALISYLKRCSLP